MNGSYAAKILADSVSESGSRLTSFLVTFPRIVLAEWNTHRVFSRNTASSRAIPVSKIVQMVLDSPFIPETWPVNQPGMSASSILGEKDSEKAVKIWLAARDAAVHRASELQALGVHKQITNRLLEPFLYTTVLVSSTEWKNFFHLRTAPDAQPEIQTIAKMMQVLYLESHPVTVSPESWHIPFYRQEEDTSLSIDSCLKVNVARCARLSYLTFDGRKSTEDDLDLYEKLKTSQHWSPFEHIATPCEGWHGNFYGWKQYRQLVDTVSKESHGK
jgi:thymidylate synthase ThyX